MRSFRLEHSPLALSSSVWEQAQRSAVGMQFWLRTGGRVSSDAFQVV